MSAMRPTGSKTSWNGCAGLGALVVQNPVPAVAFDLRRIAWAYTRQKLLIELLER